MSPDMTRPTPQHEADPLLAALVLDGESVASEQLVHAGNRPLICTPRSILRNDADADDAVQIGFIPRAVEGLGAVETARSQDRAVGSATTAPSTASAHLRTGVGREIGAGIDDFFAVGVARFNRLVAAARRRPDLALPEPPPG